MSYNWDDIVVGEKSLNHSNHFFDKKHMKHERIFNEFVDKENDQNTSNQSNRIKNVEEVTKILENCQLVEAEPTQKGTEKKVDGMPKLNRPVTRSQTATITATKAKNLKKIVEKTKTVEPPVKMTKKTKNTNPVEFNVYRYANTYAEKKKRLLIELEKKMKEERMFHSKPAPDFGKMHKKSDKKYQQLLKLPTCPETPEVLQRGKYSARQCKKIEELIQQRQRKFQFHARDCEVINKDPFKPILEKHIIESEPFDLKMTTRLQQRKQYDANLRKMMDEKERERKEKEIAEEVQYTKDLRKQLVFKARPNPFK